ncbi:hypothetical protein PPYR_14826 [Photinus pyralis]|uniref:Short-chain dehydrogenase/reductase 3 n=1 Tax=Photinus pyralis TaxID=7054 RepID=A0A5N4A6B6_PHOPY|nr:short-chain dehydrogenase/reductase family 16C member 6-like [Photinus pyralis]KAB0792867.1 hypothetical protein PPYR_14826 [Photinus pyralis]
MWFKELVLRVVGGTWEFLVICALCVYYCMETVLLTITPSFLRWQKSLKGKRIVITGGAGGVGQELALQLGRLQAKVVVWDTNERAVEALRLRFYNEGMELQSYIVDVTDRHSVYKHANLVKSDLGPVDILINNAGIVTGRTFLDIPDDMVEKTFQVNVISHYWTIKAFLSDMLKRGKGHVVSVGSLTGMLGTYKCTDYSATKYALHGLHESLLTELKTHGYDNIHLTLVSPFFINTGMFAGCKPRTLSMLEPKNVATRIITAIRREETFLTMPASYRFIIPIKFYVPSKLCWAVMYRVIQGPQSMMGLVGRQDTTAA